MSNEPGGSMVTKALSPLWADANGVNKAAVIKVRAKTAKGKVHAFFIFFLLLCVGPGRRV
jgi:hypothetical protein